MLRLITLATFVAAAQAAIGPNTNLLIANANVNPDGFVSRSAVLVGAAPKSLSFPGPVIKAFKGDTFNINVMNALLDETMERATSIVNPHWHGIFQRGSSWADGPAGVTQCPIIPGNSFVYRFSAARQAGTFWYHSHHHSQYCDGLRGAMVVYDPADPHRSLYEIDNEDTIITLADWYHSKGPELEKLPVVNPDSTLINGRGRTAQSLTVPLAVVRVKPNKKYRFRLVSISCSPSFTFSIDGHTITIIEADGKNTEPLLVDSIEILAGQRYSFILDANQTPDNYWIRSNPSRGPRGFADGLNSAVLRYISSGVKDEDPRPREPPVSRMPLQEANLHPLENPPAPGPPIRGGKGVHQQPLKIELVGMGPNWTVNGAPFFEPTPPVLLQILSKNRPPQELLPKGSVFGLPRNTVIELTMPVQAVTPANPHPMHLHGHSFSVVRSAGSSVDNFKNPVRRDVVSMGVSTSDNVTIRFVTDNPGPWILHCHIDWHLVHGLAVVFAEDIPSIKASPPPAKSGWDDLCPAYKTWLNETK